jgi:hypothetical protein
MPNRFHPRYSDGTLVNHIEILLRRVQSAQLVSSIDGSVCLMKIVFSGLGSTTAPEPVRRPFVEKITSL